MSANLNKLLSMSAILLLGGCASSGVNPSRMTTAQLTSDLPAPDPRDVGGSMQELYYVGPSDKLAIFVSDLPDMTQTVMVDPAGFISLPIVGQVKAGGFTTEQIRSEIADRLGRDVLVRPVVSVGIAETMSQRITIDGAVAKPGTFPIAGTTTLMRALTLASGTSSLASERQVIVYRTVGDKRMAALFDLKMIRGGEANDPLIYGNDVIVVGTSPVRQALRDIGMVFPLLGAFYTIDRITQ